MSLTIPYPERGNNLDTTETESDLVSINTEEQLIAQQTSAHGTNLSMVTGEPGLISFNEDGRIAQADSSYTLPQSVTDAIQNRTELLTSSEEVANFIVDALNNEIFNDDIVESKYSTDTNSHLISEKNSVLYLFTVDDELFMDGNERSMLGDLGGQKDFLTNAISYIAGRIIEENESLQNQPVEENNRRQNQPLDPNAPIA